MIQNSEKMLTGLHGQNFNLFFYFVPQNHYTYFACLSVCKKKSNDWAQRSVNMAGQNGKIYPGENVTNYYY